MKEIAVIDPGADALSYIRAHIPSTFAKQCLYYLLLVGHFFCNPDYAIRRDYLDMFLLIYVREGQLQIESEGQSCTVGPGELFLLNCKMPHAYRAITEKTEFQWIHFNGRTADAYYDYIYSSIGNLPHRKTPAEETVMQFSKLMRVMHQPLLDEQAVSLVLQAILKSFTEAEDAPQQAISSYIAAAVDYYRAHLAEEVSIQKIAESLNLNSHYFIRKFKREMRQTPHEFLIQLRIKQAVELLAEPNLNMDDISFQCGFHSASHFARTFRKVMNCSPTEFRNLHF